MNWIVDIILAAIFVLTVLVCVKRGFVKSIWSLFRAVVSVGAAFLFGRSMGEWLMNRFLFKKFTDIAYSSLSSIVHENNGSFDLSELFSSMPESFTSLLERFGADTASLSEKFAGKATASSIELNELASDIAKPVAQIVSQSLGYVIVFLSAFLVISIIGLVVKLIAELPVIRGVNHLLGGLFGVICGFIYLWVICTAIAAFVESGLAQSESRNLVQLAQQSYIFRFFCNFSPFDYINISKIAGFISTL